MNTLEVNSKDNLNLIKDEIIPVYRTTDGGEKVVDAKELHEYLNVSTYFTTWFDRKIEQYGFEEDLDFVTTLCESNGGRPSKEYMLPINSTKTICRKSKQPNKQLIQLLNKIDGTNKEVYISLPDREELIFKEELDITLGNITPIEHQYSVLSYFIDFYLPEYNLAIEFDEEHHRNQQEEDLTRQKEIEEEIDCTFIRVKSNEKLSIGLNKILKEVL